MKVRNSAGATVDTEKGGGGVTGTGADEEEEGGRLDEVEEEGTLEAGLD